MTRQIRVVGAVVVESGRVLCVQRGPRGALPGLWEFPGGKVEPHEAARDALRREIREELDCEVAVGDEVATTAYAYDFGVVTLTTFYCTLTHGTPRLVEHADLVWSLPDDLDELDWAPADIPAVERIMRELGRAGAQQR